MFAPLLFGVLLKTHQLPKISLELRGVRLENSAPILAKALGLDSLSIDPRLKNDVLLIRVKQADPEVFKANLARVLNASWSHGPSGWYFGQTDAQRSAETKEYNNARKNYFLQLVEKSRKLTLGSQPFDAAEYLRMTKEKRTGIKAWEVRNSWKAYYASKRLEQANPVHRFAYRLISRIRVEDWMKLTDQNPHAIFCSNPNSMQYPITFRFDDIARSFVDEQNRWLNYGGQFSKPGGLDEIMGLGVDEDSLPFARPIGPQKHLDPSDLSVVTFALDLNSESIQVKGYDNAGIESLSVRVTESDFEVYDENIYSKDIKELRSKKAPKLSPEAKSYIGLSRSSYQRNPAQKISDALIDKILHPEIVDPLSIAAPEVFLSASEKPNMIMVLGEELLTTERPNFRKTSFESPDGVVLDDSSDWFLVKQINPVAKRKSMPDRKRLGERLRLISSMKRTTSLEEDARFAISLPWEKDAYDSYQSHFLLVQPNEVDTFNDQTSLRLYGSLDSTQIARAKNGGIQLSKLSPEVKRELYRALFCSEPEEGRTIVDDTAEVMTERMQASFWNLNLMSYGSILTEKTFLLPNGISDAFFLTIEDSSRDQLYGLTSYGTMGDQSRTYGQADPSQLGDAAFRATKPERYFTSEDEARPNLNEIYVTANRTITISLHVNHKLSVSWSLSKTAITDPKAFSIKDLPKQFQASFQSAYNEAKKSDEDFGADYDRMRVDVRRGNPPPPL